MITYPEMNAKIKEILRLDGSANALYAAQRIEELEEDNHKLREVYTVAKKLISNCACNYDECSIESCANCSFYALKQALAALSGGEKPQTVIVTEDDGYPD